MLWLLIMSSQRESTGDWRAAYAIKNTVAYRKQRQGAGGSQPAASQVPVMPGHSRCQKPELGPPLSKQSPQEHCLERVSGARKKNRRILVTMWVLVMESDMAFDVNL